MRTKLFFASCAALAVGSAMLYHSQGSPGAVSSTIPPVVVTPTPMPTPSDARLQALIIPLIPSPAPAATPFPAATPSASAIASAVGTWLQANPPAAGKDGQTPTTAQLQAIIAPLIPAAIPGPSGSPGAPGVAATPYPPATPLPAVTPSAAQIASAVATYIAANPPAAGATGSPGPAGSPGPTPTNAQILAAVPAGSATTAGLAKISVQQITGTIPGIQLASTANVTLTVPGAIMGGGVAVNCQDINLVGSIQMPQITAANTVVVPIKALATITSGTRTFTVVLVNP